MRDPIKNSKQENTVLGTPETFQKHLLWLAVDNKSSFSYEKLRILAGCNILVFPDLSIDGNTYNEWKTKAENYEKNIPGTKFIFSDLLENHATETDKENGKDIADFLINLLLDQAC